MYTTYETAHLLLKILPPTAENTKQVLAFQKKNRATFERYEVARPANFYTETYQQSLLSCEYNLFRQWKNIRFWIYEKQNSSQIIGTIHFYNIMRSIYERCETGYKFDEDYWHKGYARESMQFGISLIFRELHLHRMEAYVMKENQASIRLLEDLGFVYEGTCRELVRIQGNWTDHMLFSLLK